MRNPKKVLISAKCQSRSKRIIKDSKYTYGDALDFFARVITNRSTNIKSLISLVDAEIFELNLHMEKIQAEINEKEDFKNKLTVRTRTLNINNNHDLMDQNLKSSLESIKSMAADLNCRPWEIDNFTGSDTLSFYAKKCNISIHELEQHLKV